MKVLLSAYACNPSASSDNAVAWGWATQLSSQGIEVWVLTRELNRPAIEGYAKEHTLPGNLHFAYYENTVLLPILKVLRARFRYFYYYAWQYYAYRRARDLHREHGFDVVHHVTWVQARSPSFMGRLGIPFVLGPVAGGEATPWSLRPTMGPRQWFVDLLRDAWSLLSSLDPLVRSTYRQATKVFAATAETMSLIPARYRNKASIQLAIALPAGWSENRTAKASRHGPLRVLYLGRFLGLKGMALGLEAMGLLRDSHPDVKLTMVGRGPAAGHWREIAKRHRLDDTVTWIDWIPYDQVSRLYEDHDLLLFPSFHDSGGLVVLEAMAYGLPVVCLDLGGPGVIVDAASGIKVTARGCQQAAVVANLASAICELADNPDTFARLSQGALRRAREFTWDQLFAAVYAPFLKQRGPSSLGLRLPVEVPINSAMSNPAKAELS